MSYSKQVLREFYNPNETRPQPQFTRGPLGFDTGMPGGGRNIGGGGGGGLPPTGVKPLIGGTIGLIGSGIGAIRNIFRRPAGGDTGDTGGGGGGGGWGGQPLPPAQPPAPAAPRPNTSFFRDFVDLVKQLKQLGIIGVIVSAPIAAAGWIKGRAGAVDSTLDDQINKMPLPTQTKEWLKKHKYIVLVYLFLVGGSVEILRRNWPKIQKAITNRRVAAEIKEALDAGDEELARVILFDAIEDEGVNISRLRTRLSDNDFDRLLRDM